MWCLLEFQGEGDSVFFALVEFIHGRIVDMKGLTDLNPSRRSTDPVLYRERRFRMFQLVPDDGGQNHSVEQSWKDVDMLDEDQIIDRSGIGDDELHPLESKTVKVLQVAA
jgi:hypothetical protein